MITGTLVSLRNFRNNVQMVSEKKNWITHILVVDVAEREPNCVGAKVTEGGAQPFFPVREEHKVENHYFMAEVSQRS